MTALAKHRAEVEFFRKHPGEAFDESPLSAPLDFQVEQYLEVVPELKRLYPAHWKEIALERDQIPLDPDYEAYERYAKEGSIHLVTARASGWLVGYHLSFIKPHLHYRKSLQCFTDIFYLLPEFRSGLNGYKMLKFFRDTARARGVQKITISRKLHFRDIDAVIKRLGFTPIETVYTMVL